MSFALEQCSLQEVWKPRPLMHKKVKQEPGARE
jgi:hypothetical protein